MYRVVKGFLVQFGVSSEKGMNEKFGHPHTIPDDPHVPENTFERVSTSLLERRDRQRSICCREGARALIFANIGRFKGVRRAVPFCHSAGVPAAAL